MTDRDTPRSDDDRFKRPPEGQPNNDDNPGGEEPPASVVFMEMMRRAAARNVAEEEEAVEELTPESSDSTATRPEPPPLYMTEQERRQAAAMEAQRVRRVQRRRQKRQARRSGITSGFILTWFIVIVSGALIATILSWSTSPDSLSLDLRREISRIDNEGASGAVVGNVNANEFDSVMLPATAVPTPNFMIRIGIVSGHMGPQNDPGAVCPDGLTEAEINFEVADRAWRLLRERGYTVDLLEEFDARLEAYRADLLVSIHSNDCRDYGEFVSGYLISQAEARPTDGPDARLVECLALYYGEATSLDRRFGLTRDMTDYHIFREIHISTPGAIMELGFMKDDREILTTQPDLLAQAIVDGIECYLDPNALPPISPGAVPTPTPTPSGA